MNSSLVAACLAVAVTLSAPALAAGKAEKKAAAKADGPLVVTVKPPSGQWEGAPPPADGWTWRAGYHDWNGERFVWKPGEWILDKAGMDFRQYQWVEAGEGKWKLVGGDWVPERHAGSR